MYSMCICVRYLVYYGSTVALPLAGEGDVFYPPRHSVYKLKKNGEDGILNDAHWIMVRLCIILERIVVIAINGYASQHSTVLISVNNIITVWNWIPSPPLISLSSSLSPTSSSPPPL